MAEKVLLYLLAFLRAWGVLAFLPVFGSRNVPWMTKASLALITAFVVFPFVPESKIETGAEFLALGARDFLFGALLGFMGRLFFAAAETAGQLISYKIGLGLGEILDVQGEYSLPVISNFTGLLALLVFLASGGHHFFFKALVESYRIPLEGKMASVAKGILERSPMVLELALRLSAPLMVLNFLFYLGLVVVGRAVVQMNVFLVSLPMQVGLGLLGLGVLLPHLPPVMKGTWEGLGRWLLQVLSP